MLTIATETFSQLAHEASHLAAAHWDEVEAPLHGQQTYALDHTRYATLERLGMLHISAARGHTDAATCPDSQGPAADGNHALQGRGSIPQTPGSCRPLAGYAAFTLVACPHRQQTLLAALDGLYLAPWARGGLFALRLLRHAETALAARGVELVQYSSPASRPCHALYRRLGAQPTETIWHKTLRLKANTAAADRQEETQWP